MSPIDLDHNATSPLDPEVLEVMRPLWLAGGNPESRHASGRAARRALLSATETIAKILIVHPDEIVFTSGGTEANNLAIFGLARSDQGTGCIVSSPIEHPAVAEPVAKLEARGFVVARPEVSSEGLADSEVMAKAVHGDTAFATLILAHNETGALQPVARFVELSRARETPIHTDAVQAVGRIPVDFHALGVATLAASGHKFGGPVGVGMLLVKRGIVLSPHLYGGGQQNGRRPGTVPVALIAGMAAALERWHRDADATIARWSSFRDRLESRLIAALGAQNVILNGPRSARLPQTLHVGFPGRDGDSLLVQLDFLGVRASLGSACASGSTQASPTLLAMRVPDDRLRSSVRFSLGPNTTESEIDSAAERIVAAVKHAKIFVADPISPRASFA